MVNTKSGSNPRAVNRAAKASGAAVSSVQLRNNTLVSAVVLLNAAACGVMVVCMVVVCVNVCMLMCAC